MGRGEAVARTVPSPHEEGKAMSDVEDGVREPAPPAKNKGRGAVVCWYVQCHHMPTCYCLSTLP
jgi:hypothetical protein